MKSRWNDDEAKRYVEAALAAGQSEELGLRIYTSRIIGGDPDLVLHGGGNTSVKVTAEDGSQLMHIKGSGWDLDTIEAAGLPAVRLPALLATRDGAKLSDPDMVALLRSNLVDPKAPNPSVEALLHAFLPFAFVDHTHATAILALADQPDMRETVKRIYGKRVAYVPYVMPGYDLSIEGDRVYRDNLGCEGLWLENHGLFTFADTARKSYDLMIEFVTLAEDELQKAGVILDAPQESDRSLPSDFVRRLKSAMESDGLPFANGLYVDYRSTPAIRHYASRPDLDELAQRGTVTPDHVIRIKPWPLIIDKTATTADIADALQEFRHRYNGYFERNAALANEPKTMLDPYPRLIVIRGEGIAALGVDTKAARICGDLCEQATRAINAAEAYGRFTPIGEKDLFDMEYWSLEQAKLANSLERKTN